MLTLAAILLAVLVLPSPWGVVVVVAAALVDLGETVALVRWTRRRRSPVGREALVGREAVASARLDPRGRVRLDGELWAARSADGAVVEPGTRVEVVGIEALLLVVRPIA